MIGWIDDLGAWMRSATAALRGGGSCCWSTSIRSSRWSRRPTRCGSTSRTRTTAPRSFDEPGSYAGADLDVAATATVEYGHSLAEVVNAALAAGLRIQRLDEYLDADFDPRGDLLAREDDGRYRLRVDGEPLPVLFALVAAKP